MKKSNRILIFNSIAGTLLLIAFVCFIEGFCSWGFAFKSLAISAVHSRHIQFDPQLGWVGAPEVTVYNAFDNGSEIFTNAEGFRESANTPKLRPAGTQRIVCSGDSFTFGDEASNDETWCDLLKNADKNIDTVNLGQSGYGVDQAFLKYRSLATFQHDLHLFALIAEDVDRMRLATFASRSKPVLGINADKLMVRNTPLPTKAESQFWIDEANALMRELRIGRLIAMLRQEPEVKQPLPMDELLSKRVLQRVFAELRSLGAARRAKQVVVLLPIQDDYYTNQSLALRQGLRSMLGDLQVPFIDLIGELKELSAEEMEILFNPHRSGFQFAHYSLKGNLWVTQRIAHHQSLPLRTGRLDPQDRRELSSEARSQAQ